MDICKGTLSIEFSWRIYIYICVYVCIRANPKWLNPGHGYHGSVSTMCTHFPRGEVGGFQGIVRRWWICANDYVIALLPCKVRLFFFFRLTNATIFHGARFLSVFKVEIESMDNFWNNFFSRASNDKTSIVNEFFHRFDLHIPLDELVAGSRWYVKVKKLGGFTGGWTSSSSTGIY